MVVTVEGEFMPLGHDAVEQFGVLPGPSDEDEEGRGGAGRCEGVQHARRAVGARAVAVGHDDRALLGGDADDGTVDGQ